MPSSKKNYAKFVNKVHQQCCQCQNWFLKFRPDDLDIKNAARFGRPVKVENEIKKPIGANRRRLNLSNSTVHDHTKRDLIMKKNEIYNIQVIPFNNFLEF